MEADMIKNALKKLWHEWGIPVLIVLSIMCPLRSAIADYNYIPSGSMQPTLLVGDNVLVNKLAYDLKIPFTTWHLASWSNPKRGEVVVFYGPQDRIRMVKRVIGLPGDKIELRDNTLFINGQAQKYSSSEPNCRLPEIERNLCRFSREKLGDKLHDIMTIPFATPHQNFGPIEVPVDKYFLLGDCRDNSKDSRFWGFVERNDILGRVEAVLWSKPAWELTIPATERFFLPVI